MFNPISWYRERQARKKMYKELNDCLMNVARAMDGFGDTLVEGGENNNQT